MLLAKTFGCVRVVWNWALDIKQTMYQETGETISSFNLMKRMKRELKTEKKWLCEVNSQSLQNSIVNLEKAFTNFFRGKARYPRFKNKHEHQSFQCPQGCSVDFKRGTISIPKVKGIPAILHRRFRGEVKTVTISKTATGKYYASVLVNDDVPTPQKPTISDEETTIGIDVGLKTLAVLSDGREFDSPHYASKEARKMKLLQRRLSKKVRGSKSYRRIRQRIAKLHEHITNCRTDYLHKITHHLTHESQVRTICVENLNVKGMQRNSHIARSVSDTGIGMFMRMLEYKCEWQGLRLVKIGRFDPSSQLCHVCGHRYFGLRLSEREWTCPSCGTHHDRDLNAAINIKNFGLGLNKALPSVRGKVKPVKQPPVDDRCPVQPKKQCCAEAGKERVI